MKEAHKKGIFFCFLPPLAAALVSSRNFHHDRPAAERAFYAAGATLISTKHEYLCVQNQASRSYQVSCKEISQSLPFFPWKNMHVNHHQTKDFF